MHPNLSLNNAKELKLILLDRSCKSNNKPIGGINLTGKWQSCLSRKEIQIINLNETVLFF